MYTTLMFESSSPLSSSYEKSISILWAVEENKTALDDSVIPHNKLKMWNGDINVSSDAMVHFYM